MEIEDYIEKIIDNGEIKDMNALSEILEDILEKLKEYDEKLYKKYEMCLYEMAYGTVLNKEMAKQIVNKMKPYGLKWNMQEIQRIQEQFGLENINPIDFFVVMNSAYNDYRDLFNDNIEMYARYTRDFIEDEDAKKDKVFNYFMTIPE